MVPCRGFGRVAPQESCREVVRILVRLHQQQQQEVHVLCDTQADPFRTIDNNVGQPSSECTVSIGFPEACALMHDRQKACNHTQA